MGGAADGVPDWTDALQAKREGVPEWPPVEPKVRLASHLLEAEGNHLRTRIAELERREALLTAFVMAEDRFNAMMDSGDWDGDDDAYLAMMAARQSLTEAGFPWSDAQ